MTVRAAAEVEPAEVLHYWFGDPPLEVRSAWFRKDPKFDAEIAQRYGLLTQAAISGQLDARWAATPAARLASLIVLDQFTRNLGRGTPAAFAGDASALALARRMRQNCDDQSLPLLQRWFAYMPFEHAEDVEAQHEAVRLFTELAEAGSESPCAAALKGALDYARRHREVIERFGRFPHRNEALGRISTAAELAYLAEPGAGF